MPTTSLQGHAMSATIRTMLRGDVPAVIEILRDCHRQPGGAIPQRYATDLRDVLFDSLAGITLHVPQVLVATVGEEARVVGAIAFRRAFVSAAGWDIAYWGVCPTVQGAGVGGRLLDAALLRIQNRAEPDHFVMVRTGRPDVFERRGFQAMTPGPAALMLAWARDLQGARLAQAAE
ncbi:N-acetylglutamate synthase-like GNAT family acetyltransferase [Azospirillum baldaniorum]|uniref:GNAT family N-acetyltransferase n=1 Tax=Azospirillum baldaniorum TaxID=1064539 RepID=UPI0011AD0FEF|nr:GNAT family N-acetyltransferase [Azospirillum baldaniorum]TWA71890.1 N-acetylglutamate synthase-like GNAT family acetyltransferase [Azospirillum baldaniorum]